MAVCGACGVSAQALEMAFELVIHPNSNIANYTAVVRVDIGDKAMKESGYSASSGRWLMARLCERVFVVQRAMARTSAAGGGRFWTDYCLFGKIDD